MSLHLLRLLARYPAQARVLLLRLQFHALQIAPRRLQGIAEIVLLRQQLAVYRMFKPSLQLGIRPRGMHLPLYLLVLQDIEASDGITVLFSYTLQYNFHKFLSVK